MPHLTPSPDAQRAAECILSALESARIGATNIPDIRAIGAKLTAAMASSQGASELNKCMFAVMEVKQILSKAGLAVVWPDPINHELLDSFYAGILYGSNRNSSGPLRELPRTVRVEERDKSGRDISKEVSIAAVCAYNLLAGEARSHVGSGVADLHDTAQVVKCLSQLIAANVTSERNVLHGAIFAGIAVANHFQARGLLALPAKTSALLAGIIFSVIKEPAEHLAPPSGPLTADLKPEHQYARDFSEAACPAIPEVDTQTNGMDSHGSEVDEKEELHHKQNTHALTTEQCKLFAKTLMQAAEEGRDLDHGLKAEVLKGCPLEALNTLGRDILEVQGDSERDVTELRLGGRTPRVQPWDVIKAVAYRLDQVRSSDDLSRDYLELAARAAELAKEGVVENGCYELPSRFLDNVSFETLRELAEDCLCAENDEHATMEDKEPLTAQHMNEITLLVDCLEAFAFRLRSIAVVRKPE